MKVQSRAMHQLGFDQSAALPRTCWPTVTQRLLLQACLGGPELARTAFTEWHARVDIFKLDHGSNRLMALLYRNLERAGVRAPEHEILKGNWRYHWYVNKTRVRDFAVVQSQMAAAGIPVVALKGLPLAAFFYEDLGVRPMGDIDVLVPRDCVHAAIACLLAQGFRPYAALDERMFEGPGMGFSNQVTSNVDLHWRVLHDSVADWSDEAFLAGSESRDFDGVTIRSLRAEDQIIHLCAHGMTYSPLPPLRWLADVATVIRRRGDALDTDYLLREAARRELINPVKHTFAWLARHLDLPGMHPVRRVLPSMHAVPAERFAYLWRVHPATGLPGFVPAWTAYRRIKTARMSGSEMQNEAADFLTFYARRKKLSGRFSAAVDIAVMSVKRLPGWAARRIADWVIERADELERGSAFDLEPSGRRVV
jgi:hypothetical protein